VTSRPQSAPDAPLIAGASGDEVRQYVCAASLAPRLLPGTVFGRRATGMTRYITDLGEMSEVTQDNGPPTTCCPDEPCLHHSGARERRRRVQQDFHAEGFRARKIESDFLREVADIAHSLLHAIHQDIDSTGNMVALIRDTSRAA